ncbi:hypothetical protein [Calothrix sp. NIES-2098]|uniref:hypothetical protein n=1 Tax=Calothrix sp. NIES-2098 TaxID=1954171 RepID=UPI000B61D03D|nr:hypothetical protein NIES2098_42130 [Calothrix sp. NIES-2098]
MSLLPHTAIIAYMGYKGIWVIEKQTKKWHTGYVPVTLVTHMSDSDKVSFKVFLTEEERTRFKIACAQERSNMSEKAREFILKWLETREKSV